MKGIGYFAASKQRVDRTMSWAGLSFVILSSTIVIPGQGRFSPDNPSVAPPVSSGPSGREGKSLSESPEQREERLRREGIRKEPEKAPAMDYVSVLKRQISPEGGPANLPPDLWFGFGFGSWFPLRESPGRVSVPFGSYHLFAQLGSLNDRNNGGLPCSKQELCRFDSVHLFALSTVGAMEIPGINRRTEESIRYAVEVSDLDWGAAWRRDWLWSMGHSETYQWGTGLMAGWLPLRQRSIVQYGDGVAAERDLLRSGFQINPSGFVSRASISAVVLSRFEAGLFAGFNTGFPAEMRLWFGLELAMRDPRADGQAPPVETESRDETETGRGNEPVAPGNSDHSSSGDEVSKDGEKSSKINDRLKSDRPAESDKNRDKGEERQPSPKGRR